MYKYVHRAHNNCGEVWSTKGRFLDLCGLFSSCFQEDNLTTCLIVQTMLKELRITNFRLFRDLHIPKLGQVNLIAGKNNVGKTALLEALRIYFSKGSASVINNIIFKRGDLEENKVLDTYSSLFYNRDYKNVGIIINEVVFYLQISRSGFFQKFKIFHSKEDYKNFLLFFNNPNVNKYQEFQYLGDEVPDYRNIDNYSWSSDIDFVITSNIEQENTSLWDSVVLTVKEEAVTEALQLIEPRIMRIAVDSKISKTKLRLESENRPIGLKNMGDGVSRMFAIALAMVNAENKYLIIDEFEIGLHYSVQEKLWDWIFLLSQKLNVQVFATTHSRDCIEAFTKASSKTENQGVGNYFRLQKKRGSDKIIAVDYSIEDLEIAILQDIETR